MGGRTIRTRGIIVVSEIALAVILLTGAGLLLKSLVALRNADLGFHPEHALVIKATGVRSREQNNAVFGRIMARLTALPGVAAVGATSVPPGDFSNAGTGAHCVDRIPEQREHSREPETLMTIVAPGTFAALGIPLKTGRDFDEGDSGDRPLVACGERNDCGFRPAGHAGMKCGRVRRKPGNCVLEPCDRQISEQLIRSAVNCIRRRLDEEVANADRGPDVCWRVRDASVARLR